MLTYLRYALATVCFAASVGCLALWWRSTIKEKSLETAWYEGRSIAFTFQILESELFVTFPAPINGSATPKGWRYRLDPVRDTHLSELEGLNREQGVFGQASKSIYFPLWYPPLIFAVAGIGVLRSRRRFTLRSAIVATTVVAGLLGMAVAL